MTSVYIGYPYIQGKLGIEVSCWALGSPKTKENRYWASNYFLSGLPNLRFLLVSNLVEFGCSTHR